MKDLLYSSGLEDQLNFENDFDFVPVVFGNLRGRLKSITDVKVNNTTIIEIITDNTVLALSMLRGDYPDSVIIKTGGKDFALKISVTSFKVSRDTGETIVQIGGEYAKE